MSELAHIIGCNVRVRMVMLRKRPGQVAEESGISRQALLNIREERIKMIRLATLERLAKCLQMTVSELTKKECFYEERLTRASKD